jgi:hypothetical protein
MNINLHVKEALKMRVLRWRSYPGLPMWALSITTCPYKDAETTEWRKGREIPKAERDLEMTRFCL